MLWNHHRRDCPLEGFLCLKLVSLSYDRDAAVLSDHLYVQTEIHNVIYINIHYTVHSGFKQSAALVLAFQAKCKHYFCRFMSDY